MVCLDSRELKQLLPFELAVIRTRINGNATTHGDALGRNAGIVSVEYEAYFRVVFLALACEIIRFKSRSLL
jgi:hypothetical protein